MKKKAQGISMNVIIIAAIALIVMIVLIAIFTGKMGKIGVEGKEAEDRAKANICLTKEGSVCSEVCPEGLESAGDAPAGVWSDCTDTCCIPE